MAYEKCVAQATLARATMALAAMVLVACESEHNPNQERQYEDRGTTPAPEPAHGLATGNNRLQAGESWLEAPAPDEIGFGTDDRADVILTLEDAEDPAEDDAARERRLAALQSQVLAALNPQDFMVTRRYALLPALALQISQTALPTLRALPEVLAVQPDALVHTDALPGTLVQATLANQQLGLTGTGVRVAVLDSGVDAAHPDLAGRVVAQHCFAKSGCPGTGKPEGPSAQDQNGHGTHVASLVLGAGKVAPQGMAPGARLVAVRVLSKAATGPTSDVLAGLDWVAKQAGPLGIRVVNLSLGGQKTYAGTCDTSDPASAKAVQLLVKKGVAVFAAAGNDGALASLSSPACLKGVTSVGAAYTANYGAQKFPGLCTDAKSAAGQVACFSNRSAGLDLLAPGAYLTGASPGGGKAIMAGTSQATPIAVGVAALLLGCKPSLTPAGLQAVLQNTGKPIADAKSCKVFRLVQAYAAAKSVCAL